VKTILAVIGFVVVFAFVAGTCAFCGDDDDHNSQPHAMAVVARHHEQPRCYDDCDDDWGRGSGNGNSGYDGEGGRSGDYDGGPGDDCRNACGNTIIVPMPGQSGEQPPEGGRA
jgi:hypothetical protein